MQLNKQDVYNGLIQRGYPPNAAAGIVGNLHWESGGLNPAILGDGGNSGGLAQWNGPRFAALKEAAAKKGVDWTDPNHQLDFLDQELRARPEGKTLLDPKTSYADANNAFLMQFERPANPGASAKNRFDAGADLAANPGTYSAPNFATVRAGGDTTVADTTPVNTTPTKEPEKPKTYWEQVADAFKPGGSLFQMTQQPQQQQQQAAPQQVAQGPAPQAPIYSPQQPQLSLLQQIYRKGNV